MEPVIFFAAATSSTCYMFMRMLEAVEISHLFNVLGTTAFFLMCVCGVGKLGLCKCFIFLKTTISGPLCK